MERHRVEEELEAYRDYLKEIRLTDSQGNTRELPEYIKVQLDERFTFEDEMEDGKEVLWEAANFFDVPLAAVMPLMSKMIIDVQDAQEDVLSWLLGGIEAKSYKFTNLMPLVVPESNYILRGDPSARTCCSPHTTPPTLPTSTSMARSGTAATAACWPTKAWKR